MSPGAWLQPGTCRRCASCRLRRARGLGGGAPVTRRPPRRPLVRRRHRTARGCSVRRPPGVADRDRAALHARRARRPGVAAFARDGAELYAKGAHLDPEAFLRMFLDAVGSDFDPPSPLPPALEQGVRALMRGARAVGGGDPAGAARRARPAEARRLGRAPPRVRRDLRRPRAGARRRAPRAPGLRSQRAAPPGLQRGAARLRRARQRRCRRPGRSPAGSDTMPGALVRAWTRLAPADRRSRPRGRPRPK